MPHRIVHNHTLVHSPDCSLNSGLNFKLRTDVYSTYLLNSTLCNEDNTSCWSLRFVLKSISRPILILNSWVRSEDHTSALAPKSIPGIEDHSFFLVHISAGSPLSGSPYSKLKSTFCTGVQIPKQRPHLFLLKLSLHTDFQNPHWYLKFTFGLKSNFLTIAILLADVHTPNPIPQSVLMSTHRTEIR